MTPARIVWVSGASHVVAYPTLAWFVKKFEQLDVIRTLQAMCRTRICMYRYVCAGGSHF